MASWSALKLQIPGKDFLEKVRGILETLLIFLDILKAILEMIKAFLIDFGNPLRMLVEALMKLIRDLFEALKRTGLYAYFDIPNPLDDPNFSKIIGGYEAFTLRWAGSLLDGLDHNRPQPIEGALTGGFIMIVVEAQGVGQIISLILAIMAFFGKRAAFPRFLPPANLRVLPCGQKGDPILAVESVFASQCESIILEWSLASSTPSAKPSVTGLAASVAQEFVPTQWLIERAEEPLTQEIVIDPMKNDSQLDSNLVGPVMMNLKTKGLDPRNINKEMVRRQRVVDIYGDPVIKFNRAYVLDTNSGFISLLLGQLGTFRYIDNDVLFDKVYYYRVRAYMGSIDYGSKGVRWKGPLVPDVAKKGQYYLPWPVVNPKKNHLTMGRASPIVRIRLAKIPDKFDVIENLRRLFLTAFSLNFHLPLDPSIFTLGPDGNFLHGDYHFIGMGSLESEGGLVIGLPYGPHIGSKSPAAAYTGTDGMPWQELPARFQAARLATRYGGFMLEAGSSVIEGFRKLMQDPLPAKRITTTWPGSKPAAPPATIEKLIFAFTKVNLDQSKAGTIASRISEVNPTGTVDRATAKAYGDAFEDDAVRLNVLAAVNYVKALGFGGVPPDWERMSILRDLIPWSGQILYDLLAMIQALLDAINGIFDEIKKFIDLLIRKINVLEDFIRYLIELLKFILSLEFDAFLLAVPQISGDTSAWIQTVQTAGGDHPKGGPGSYSAGICLAYLAPDISGFTKAFGAIF